MDFKQIQELIKTVNKSNISELTIQDGEFQITIKQGGDVAEGASGAQGQMPMMMPMLQHMQMQHMPMSSGMPQAIPAPLHRPLRQTPVVQPQRVQAAATARR